MQSPGERLWESYLFSSKSHGLAVSVRLDAADVMGCGSAQNLHEMFQGALQGTNTGFVRAPPPQGSSVHPTKLLLARMALQTQCQSTATGQLEQKIRSVDAFVKLLMVNSESFQNYSRNLNRMYLELGHHSNNSCSVLGFGVILVLFCHRK